MSNRNFKQCVNLVNSRNTKNGKIQKKKNYNGEKDAKNYERQNKSCGIYRIPFATTSITRLFVDQAGWRNPPKAANAITIPGIPVFA